MTRAMGRSEPHHSHFLRKLAGVDVAIVLAWRTLSSVRLNPSDSFLFASTAPKRRGPDQDRQQLAWPLGSLLDSYVAPILGILVGFIALVAQTLLRRMNGARK